MAAHKGAIDHYGAVVASLQEQASSGQIMTWEYRESKAAAEQARSDCEILRSFTAMSHYSYGGSHSWSRGLGAARGPGIFIRSV
jgi:hypothetical protein